MALRTPQNILRHELIGLEAEVLDYSNHCNTKIRGTVIDETMNTLVIGGDGAKRVAKKNAVFKFKLNGKSVKVEGRALAGRPEDRVKKTIKRRW
ncbi:ribonuclease P protein component 1 [Candidatus Bathyarchaeota archaeon]|nr:ribonuclease P protein component 1 [Candidatus Bathyarchaeota archaeon]